MLHVVLDPSEERTRYLELGKYKIIVLIRKVLLKLQHENNEVPFSPVNHRIFKTFGYSSPCQPGWGVSYKIENTQHMTVDNFLNGADGNWQPVRNYFQVTVNISLRIHFISAELNPSEKPRNPTTTADV